MMRQGIQHKVGEEVYFDKMIGHWHTIVDMRYVNTGKHYQDINVFLTDGACLRFEDVSKYAYFMKESFKAKDGDAMLSLQDKAYELRKNYYTQERKSIDD